MAARQVFNMIDDKTFDEEENFLNFDPIMAGSASQKLVSPADSKKTAMTDSPSGTHAKVFSTLLASLIGESQVQAITELKSTAAKLKSTKKKSDKEWPELKLDLPTELDLLTNGAGSMSLDSPLEFDMQGFIPDRSPVHVAKETSEPDFLTHAPTTTFKPFGS